MSSPRGAPEKQGARLVSTLLMGADSSSRSSTPESSVPAPIVRRAPSPSHRPIFDHLISRHFHAPGGIDTSWGAPEKIPSKNNRDSRARHTTSTTKYRKENEYERFKFSRAAEQKFPESTRPPVTAANMITDYGFADTLADASADRATLLQAAFAATALHQNTSFDTSVEELVLTAPHDAVLFGDDDFSQSVNAYKLDALLSDTGDVSLPSYLNVGSGDFPSRYDMFDPTTPQIATASPRTRPELAVPSLQRHPTQSPRAAEHKPIQPKNAPLASPPVATKPTKPQEPPQRSTSDICDPRDWSFKHVLHWLKENGFNEKSPRYRTFAHFQVTGEDLLVMDHEELQEMFVTNEADRTAFLALLAPMKAQFCPNPILEVKNVETANNQLTDGDNFISLRVRRRTDVQHRATRYHRRKYPTFVTAIDKQKRVRDMHTFLRAESLDRGDTDTTRIQRIQKVLLSAQFATRQGPNHDIDSPRDHVRIDPEWTLQDLVFWLEDNSYPKRMINIIKALRLSSHDLILAAEKRAFSGIGLGNEDPGMLEKFRRLCIAPCGLVADDWSCQDVVAWLELVGQGIAASYIQANSEHSFGDPMIYQLVCEAARSGDDRALLKSFCTALRTSPLNGLQIRELARQPGVLERIFQLPELAVDQQSQQNVIRWLRHEAPHGSPTQQWSSNDVLAWLETEYDAVLDLELSGQEFGMVDHVFLRETLGIDASEVQAEILQSLHHNPETDTVPTSLWTVMQVWAWCSLHDLVLLGEVVLAHQIDGATFLCLTADAVEHLIERLITEEPSAVQRALHLLPHDGDLEHTKAALHRQAIETATYGLSAEISTFTTMRTMGVSRDVATVRDFLGDHPNPNWDNDEVIAWLAVHEIVDPDTRIVQRFVNVEEAIRKAENWPGGGVDGTDLIDDPTIAEHLFPPSVASTDLALLRFAVSAALESFEPLTPRSRPEDVLEFLRVHEFPRTLNVAELRLLDGATLLSMTIAELDREIRSLKGAKRDMKSKCEREAECRRLVALLHTPVWSTISMHSWTVAQTDAWLVHEGFLTLTNRHLDGPALADLAFTDSKDKLTDLFQWRVDIPALRHAIESVNDHSSNPVLSLGDRLAMYSY